MHQLLSTVEVAWDVAAIPALVLLGLCLAPKAVHARVRAIMHPWLARVVPSQLGWVAWAQRSRSKWLDHIVHTSALSVTVEFYLLGLPACYMAGLERETFLLTAALALCTALTCALKDIMCGPRPVHIAGATAATEAAAAQAVKDGTVKALTKVPRIEVLEAPRDVEYGAPSMHTSLALVMNLAVAQLTTPLLSGHTPRAGAVHLEHIGHSIVGVVCGLTGLQHHCIAPMLLQGAALAWTAWIGWSRLYLGVHTPVDLILGLCTGTALVSALVGPLGHWWFNALLTNPATIWVQAAVYAWALFNYPQAQGYTSNYVYTVTFLGAHLGLSLGDAAAWRSSRAAIALHAAALRALPPSVLQQLAVLHAPSTAGVFVAKLGVGLTLVLLVRSATSAVMRALVPPVFALFPSRIRLMWQPPIAFGPLALVAPDGTHIQRHVISAADGVQHSPDAEVSANDGQAAGSADGVAFVTSRAGAPAGLRQRKQQQENGHGSAAGTASSPVPAVQVLGGSVRADGVLLREDGVTPWDCDTVRRYSTYCMAVWIMIEYCHLLEGAASAVTQFA